MYLLRASFTLLYIWYSRMLHRKDLAPFSQSLEVVQCRTYNTYLLTRRQIQMPLFIIASYYATYTPTCNRPLVEADVNLKGTIGTIKVRVRVPPNDMHVNPTHVLCNQNQPASPRVGS